MTNASGVWVTFGLIVGLYVVLGVVLVITLRAMARRWRSAGDEDSEVPYGPSPGPPPTLASERRAVSSADAVAVVLWIGATMYAVFGGADFGAGFWSLAAGGGERGRRARELIDWAIGPVWEANHVWLIFVLVVLWTGFSIRVRGDLLDAVHPAQPGRARDRPARLGLRVPQDGAPHGGPRPRRAPVRALVAAHAVLHGHGRRRDRVGARAARQRRRRSGHELAQPGLARDRGALRRHVRLRLGGVPRQRRAPRGLRRPRALLHRPRARRGAGRGRVRDRRHRRPPRRRALRLRPPHEQRPAARDPLGAVRAGRARAPAPGHAAAAPVRWRSGRWWPSSGAGASPSTPTCCPRS